MEWRVGVDENGLGPVLGPLLVTAVMARLDEHGLRRITRQPKRLLHARLTDSKKLVDHHDVRLGEAWARAVVAAERGQPAASPDELVAALSLDEPTQLRAACPSSMQSQCWASGAEAFEATDEQVALATTDLERLRKKGVMVHWARSAIVCVKRINEEAALGRGRLDVDLHAMERLLVAGRRVAGQDMVAMCGKVGGIKSYPPRFRELSGMLHTTLQEEQACSSYRVLGLGEVHFARDADESDPLVALSSLIGKYLREVLMKRIVRYYQDLDPTLSNASGYNDPVTARFIAASGGLRKQQAVPDQCFRRKQAVPAPEP